MSGAIAEAAVRIRPDTSGFKHDLEGSVRGATSGAARIAKTGLFAGIGAGVAAAVGGFAVLKTGFDEFQQAATVTAQTTSEIKTTGMAANVTAGQVKGLASALLEKTGVDDEAIQSGENMLLTFTKIRNEAGKGNDIFNQATKAATNMSVAWGEDMHSAAIQLGKALQDPIHGMTALSRIGAINRDDVDRLKKKWGENTPVMEQQKDLLAAVNIQVGGVAESIGNTLPGKINILKETFKNLAGELVGRMAPALTKIIGYVTDKLPAAFATAERVISGVFHSDIFQGLISGIGDAISRVKSFISEFQHAQGLEAKANVVLDLAKDGVKSLYDKVKAEIERVDWSKVWTGAVGFGAGLAQQISDGLDRIDWPSVGQHIATGFKKALEGIGEIGDKVVKPLTDAMNSHRAEIADAAAALLVNMFVTLTDPTFWIQHWQLALSIALVALGGPLGKLAAGAGRLVFAAFGRFGDDIIRAILPGVEKLAPALASKLSGAFNAAVGPLEQLLPALFTRVVRAISASFDALPGLVQRVLRTAFVFTVVGMIGEAVAAAASFVKRVVTAVQDQLNILPARVKGYFNQAIAAITGTAASAGTAAKAFGKGILDGVIGSITGIVAKVKEAFTNAVAAVTGAVGGAAAASKAFAKAIVSSVEGVIGLAGKVRDAFTSAVVAATSTVGHAAAAAKAFGQGIYNGVVGSIAGLATKVKGFVGDAVTAVASVVGRAVAAAQAIGRGIVDGIIGGLAGIAARVRGFLDAVVAAVTGTISRVTSAAAAVGAAILHGIVSGITGLIGAVQAKLSGLAGLLGGAAKAAYSASLGIGSAIVNGIKDGFAGIFEGVVSTMVAKVKSLPGLLAHAVGARSPSRDTAEQVGKPMAQGIAVGFEDEIGSGAGLVASMRKALDGITNFWGIGSPSKRMADAVGKPLAQGVAKGFADESQTSFAKVMPALQTNINKNMENLFNNVHPPGRAREQLKSIFSWIANDVGGSPGVKAASAAGKALMDGVGEGVKGGAKSLKDGLTGATKNSFDGVKQFFGIGSPSKWTAEEIGKPLGQGIFDGFYEEVKSSKGGTAKAITSVFGGDDVKRAIIREAQQRGLDAAAVLAVSYTEGLSGKIGDKGTSFGPFQLHQGGALADQYKGNAAATQAWAMSLEGVAYAMNKIAAVTRGSSGLAAIAKQVRNFERPGDIPGEIAKASGLYSTAAKEVQRLTGGLLQVGFVAKQTNQALIIPGGVAKAYEDLNKQFAKAIVLKGNIDLAHRPIVRNADGTYSTVRSISVGAGQGKTVLLPTVVDKKVVSNKEAIQHYEDTGEQLGIFKSMKAADQYAEALHRLQAAQYGSSAAASSFGTSLGASATKIGTTIQEKTLTSAQAAALTAKILRSGKDVALSFLKGMNLDAAPQQFKDALDKMSATLKNGQLVLKGQGQKLAVDVGGTISKGLIKSLVLGNEIPKSIGGKLGEALTAAMAELPVRMEKGKIVLVGAAKKFGFDVGIALNQSLLKSLALGGAAPKKFGGQARDLLEAFFPPDEEIKARLSRGTLVLRRGMEKVSVDMSETLGKKNLLEGLFKGGEAGAGVTGRFGETLKATMDKLPAKVEGGKVALVGAAQKLGRDVAIGLSDSMIANLLKGGELPKSFAGKAGDATTGFIDKARVKVEEGKLVIAGAAGKAGQFAGIKLSDAMIANLLKGGTLPAAFAGKAGDATTSFIDKARLKLDDGKLVIAGAAGKAGQFAGIKLSDSMIANLLKGGELPKSFAGKAGEATTAFIDAARLKFENGRLVLEGSAAKAGGFAGIKMTKAMIENLLKGGELPAKFAGKAGEAANAFVDSATLKVKQGSLVLSGQAAKSGADVAIKLSKGMIANLLAGGELPAKFAGKAGDAVTAFIGGATAKFRNGNLILQKDGATLASNVSGTINQKLAQSVLAGGEIPAKIKGRLGDAFKTTMDSLPAVLEGGKVVLVGAAQKFGFNVGKNLNEGLIRSVVLGGAEIPAKLSAKMREGLEAARATVAGKTATLQSAFQNLTSRIKTVWDAQTTKMIAGINAKYDQMGRDLQSSIDSALRGVEQTLKDRTKSIEAARGELTPTEALIQQLTSTHAAEQQAKTIADARKRLSDAQVAGDPQAVIDAQQELDDALFDQRLTALQDQADAERAAKDAQAQSDLDAANAYAESERARLANELAQRQAALQAQRDREILDLQAQRNEEWNINEAWLGTMWIQLQKHPEQWKTINDQIMTKFGLDETGYAEAGNNLGQAFADGLRRSIAAVRAAASAVAAAAKGFFPRSPAEFGPLSDLGAGWEPGEVMGNMFADGLRRSTSAVSDAMGAMLAPTTKGVSIPSAEYNSPMSGTGAANMSWDDGTKIMQQFLDESREQTELLKRLHSALSAPGARIERGRVDAALAAMLA